MYALLSTTGMLCSTDDGSTILLDKERNMNMTVSREDMIRYAMELGITGSKEMFNSQLKEVIKETLYCNCVRLKALVLLMKERKASKKETIRFVTNWIKNNPRHLTQSHKRYINQLIFSLYVKR